jgi:DNA-binding response OmpR family regulator
MGVSACPQQSSREFLYSPVVKRNQVNNAPFGSRRMQRMRGEKEEIVSPTILIVDEDVNAQIIAETLLRLREFGVRVARDGTEACDILRHEDIAVVVLDASAPGVNGFELLRRRRGRFGPLPVATKPRILVVADRQEPEIERFALRLGADAFLRKPLAPARFIKSVQELADGAAPQAA